MLKKLLKSEYLAKCSSFNPHRTTSMTGSVTFECHALNMLYDQYMYT